MSVFGRTTTSTTGRISRQPSYVSSNTPWFFSGVRVQIFTSDKLKIEPWLVNGWQAHGKLNQAPGVERFWSRSAPARARLCTSFRS
jgi:hypothetical protein